MSRDPERRTIPRPPDAVLFEMDGALVASLEAAGSVLANTNRTAR